MSTSKKICIVGSGNWGSVIAKIVGNNVSNFEGFHNTVQMYVYEEMVDGQKLTDIINTKHENTKYLPGCIMPPCVIANPDIVDASHDADILVWVVPHQFVRGLCKQMKGKIKGTAMAISLIKGLDINERGLDLISSVIRTELGIGCAVLMGANIAPEVARENYCEATIGCKDAEIGKDLKNLFQTPYFRIVVVADEETVELCGALKNIVAVGAGVVDGLNYGDNTKAAVIRLGLMEMVKFIEEFFSRDKVDNNEKNGQEKQAKMTSGSSKIETFLESCGVADLVTTCYSGRNKRVAEAFVTSGKSIEQLEKEMLNGQKLQGPPTAAEVNAMLKAKGMEERFPLFTAIHQICVGDLPPAAFIDCLKNHPEHM